MIRKILAVSCIIPLLYACASTQTSPVNNPLPVANSGSAATAVSQPRPEPAADPTVSRRTTAPALRHLYVVKDINMRNGARSFSKPIAVLKKGDRVEEIETVNNWTKVKISSGQTGWVYNKYLTGEK